MEVSSLHVFCLDNPIRFVDPFGLEPQAPRQIGVKDVYFSEYGMYLGEDDNPSKNIRIIAYKKWIDLKKNSFGKVSHNHAVLTSALFSFATTFGVPFASYTGPMPESAILNVYEWINKHFDITNQPLSIENDPDSNALMTTHAKVIYDNQGIPIGISGAPIGINHVMWAELGFCDNIYNIASALDHEHMHELTWRADPIAAEQMRSLGREEIAYSYQMYGSIYWINTTSDFKGGVRNTYNRFFNY